ncbi:methyltransferase domain-containing protein [Massilia endophytica]|uniref:methyltransferase domain-containing protein n=1 Tax=Massilia endophytica TaxID=2899220 RepID=UPI001E3E5DF9|nr:methyltransferase domain-containing protein [Massilia endophytica]UGQ45431.1 methyltransferase domain-containing protein [Massilia endophytica]
MNIANDAVASCPVGLDTGRLRLQVRSMYERVARDPAESFHFNTGLDYAVAQLGYERAALKQLPRRCVDRFAGVGNPHRAGQIAEGATVLDHACGAGMDLLLAATKVGPNGRVIGVDMTPAMLDSAWLAAHEAGLTGRVVLHQGVFEDLPVPDASVDVVLSNGVLNLAPDKPRVMQEIARVLRPGGQLLLADVVVDRPLSAAARSDADLWAACVGGAVQAQELLRLADDAGLAGSHIVETFDCFRGTAVERKFGRAVRVAAVSISARKRA